MRRLNMFFFGSEQIHISIFIWFYGGLSFFIGVTLFHILFLEVGRMRIEDIERLIAQRKLGGFTDVSVSLSDIPKLEETLIQLREKYSLGKTFLRDEKLYIFWGSPEKFNLKWAENLRVYLKINSSTVQLENEASQEEEERLHEILVWLEEVKGMKLSMQDVEYFRSVIRLATNDGYKAAIKVTEKSWAKEI